MKRIAQDFLFSWGPGAVLYTLTLWLSIGPLQPLSELVAPFSFAVVLYLAAAKLLNDTNNTSSE